VINNYNLTIRIIMLSITDFLNKVQYGARSNLFKVFIYDFGLGELDILAKAASLPGRNLAGVQVKYKNNIVYLPGDTTDYPEWQITVINDESFTIRGIFENWMEGLKGSSGTNMLRYTWKSMSLYDALAGAEVISYSPDGDAQAVYEFSGLFPTALGDITLGWDNDNTIQEYTVSFRYNYWQRTL
jgi:hypothetical protein